MPDDSLTSGRLRLSRRAALAGGQPIGELMHQALAAPDLISLAAGFVDLRSLPVEAARAAVETIFADPVRARAALQYGSTPGFPPLRQAILDRLRQSDGDPACEHELSIERMMITPGSNQFLHLVCEALLDEGDIVLCTAPSYFVFLGLVASVGGRTIGVAMDEDGIRPDALEETLRRLDESGQLDHVKAIYCCTYFDNPSGVTLSLERRPRIVEIARRWSRDQRILVLEDVAYRELRYEGDDVPSLLAFDETSDTVVQAGTFSKMFSPGVRVGWGIMPKDLVGPITELKGNIDFGSPNLAQHVMHEILAGELIQPHIESLRKSYNAKRLAMLVAVQQHLGPLPGVSWLTPRGGMYVWLTLPEGVDTGLEGELFPSVQEAGVLYVPGHYCYPTEGPTGHNTIRLSFGDQSIEKIRIGIAALAEGIGRLL